MLWSHSEMHISSSPSLLSQTLTLKSGETMTKLFIFRRNHSALQWRQLFHHDLPQVWLSVPVTMPDLHQGISPKHLPVHLVRDFGLTL